MPDKAHDEMNVTTFQVWPEVATKGAQAVLGGTGHPRPIMLKLSNASLPGLTVNLLRAMNAVDHDGTVKGLAHFMSEIGGAPPGPAAAAEQSDMGWLLSLAATLQSDGKARGISDPVIASLLAVALGDSVMPALVDQELSRRMRDGGLASGRLSSLGLSLQASSPWSVSLDGDRSVDVDADLEHGEVAMFAASSEDSKRMFGMTPMAAYRLGIILQAAAYAVASAAAAVPLPASVKAPDPAKTEISASAPPALPASPIPPAPLDEGRTR